MVYGPVNNISFMAGCLPGLNQSLAQDHNTPRLQPATPRSPVELPTTEPQFIQLVKHLYRCTNINSVL